MNGISRRARACAVVAATGFAVLAGSATAGAQRPANTGDGIPTGQMSTQMFNFGTYLNNGGNTGAANPITGVSEACLTSTSAACRLERLEGLFAFFQRKGVTSIEVFGHAGFPSSTDIPGLVAYRALLDKYGLHAAGWHGSMSEAGWPERVNAAKILGMDALGSGGVGSPGIGSYENTLRTAETLNRLGKYSVEAGVGPVYIHNHTGEFDAKYMDNGQLKWAWQILMERTDPRYVFAEVDVFWSSDAFNDITGNETASLIDDFPSRVRMLHIKDGINVAGQPSPTNSRSGSPRATGTGEVDFRPIFAAAKNRVQYYHHEHDGGSTTDADTSFTNLKGINTAVVGTAQSVPPSFASVAAGTPAAENAVAVKIENSGDAPLNITNLQIQADALDAGSQNDFAIVGHDCYTGSGGSAVANPIAPKATAPRNFCTVNIGFKPTRTNHRSVARLQITSNADSATERVLLAAQSSADAAGRVGGEVPSALSLAISPNASFGSFVPATARTYETAMAASVVSTAGDATLSVGDPGASPGHLVNGSFALASPLQLRAANAAGPNPAWANLGVSQTLLTYSGPTAGADTVTVGLRQAIAANEVLRAGTYSKTLTFTLTTATP
jgi:sugar phosphate isomerase/epimerase